MKKELFIIVLFLGVGFIRPVYAEWEDTLKQYNCIEIERFSKGATDIDDGTIKEVQVNIIGFLDKKKTVARVRQPESPCPDRAMVLGGIVNKWNPGNRVAAGFVPFAAGQKTKLGVDAFLKDKQTGKILAKTELYKKVSGATPTKQNPVVYYISKQAYKFVKNGP